jgi:hypothetical protein
MQYIYCYILSLKKKLKFDRIIFLGYNLVEFL